ncbi:lactoylglutathione lyase [Burkholderia sp. SRS-W-2-2016]|uniref:VOC family protein n=1 Tax=Burkholderia sp. SRS-W-2-2016 TaxID=1926878 RepID=UPI00094B3448|nr:VOC family protein [Burkholderia sp. SRS-W-2-2016]OLL28740.1 lactoylglutathione lyase [Burkholderia sp. SRS-W-2-2016]
MPKLIHTMIRVQDLSRSLDFYDKVFAFKVSHRLDFPEFTLAYLRNDEADTELELTWNKGRAEPYSHGDGYGHVAFVVDDAKADRQRLLDMGLAPNDLREFHADDGALIARYFFIQDPDGYKIEVLEKHGHYR